MNKVTFTDIQIDFLKQVISDNQQIYVCQLFDIMNLFIDMRKKKIGKNKIYTFIANKYNLSVSAIQQIFSRKLTKIIENEKYRCMVENGKK